MLLILLLSALGVAGAAMLAALLLAPGVARLRRLNRAGERRSRPTVRIEGDMRRP